MLRRRVHDQSGNDPKAAAAKVMAANKLTVEDVPEGKRFIVPNFTNKQLLDAIPAHCFERSALRSSVYLVQDVVAIGLLAWGAAHIEEAIAWAAPRAAEFAPSLGTPTAATAARVTLWFLYTLFAGFFGTGLWVVAHECGHQAFSSSKTINNTVGWFLHSILLVPYHSWRISHGRHHAATGSLTRDEVFVPRTREEMLLPEAKDEDEVIGFNVSEESQSILAETLDHVPLAVMWVAVYQLLGFPLYLFMNSSGQVRYPKSTNHFDPKSVIFRKNHKWQIVWSDFGFFLTIAGAAFWAYKRSFAEMALYWGIPYLWVNNWIVLITYLQHTDPTLPHYSDNLWTFPRGALCTIDRTFLGPIGKWCVHGLCETHVSHHICSKIPHYHAWEATAALKEFLGQHYARSEENMLVSLWKSHRQCRFVEAGADVAFYKNNRGIAQRAGIVVAAPDSGVELTE